jgi:hypothetical protein
MLVAMAHVDRSDASESALEALRWATAAGIFWDKLNKAGGTAPAFLLTPEFLESEIARLEEEFGSIAPNNARAYGLTDESDIDRSLKQSLAELERRIRGDVTAELTGLDLLGRPLNPVIPPKTVG